MDVQQALLQRRSVRGFKSTPASAETLRTLFERAQRSPSWCNIQLWRVWVTSGETTARLASAMLAACDASPNSQAQIPFPASYPEPYGTHRRECGKALFSAMEIAREDMPARLVAFRANYQAFGAPHIVILAYDGHFGTYGALDMGCYLQSLMLAAEELGLATCSQAALANYPDAIRSVLPIPSDLTILCGVALGYADPDVKANTCRTSRAPLSDNVQFV